ncbi:MULTISPECIES: DUF3566 domain-containing protein [Curtobacterium]|jgi:hypothetical protein|uniref:DUF3566 domain-containing protein n=1 Tax=Curtobacterium herbarum TaxID=150122 RepID=A0ABP4K7A5_9MICO|nr:MULTISPECIES: DUF3566 domain-containing protein [Curtobacterium]MBM7477059.1 ABC-type spermidine/putrescine transport system permease subunit II [Curtobacterium herbarum]MBY0175525.1 DUF3566 domain-containing protein [Curtobacterium herbarum]MCP1503680.1 hypothetical protein [Curtobacterium herbarum]MCS6544935.1 DUF3566 domain-containing protein [Curtobacterium herbarum]MDN3478547.1 DUF3566 domain-containing protein [Curtobacterium sp. APC 4022]
MSSVAEKLQRKAKRPVGTRQVRLRLVYVDFWSMVKLSFLIALAGSIVIVVATALVWVILNQTGVFDQIDSLLKDVTGQNSYSIMDQFSLGQVLGFSIVVGILNVVVGTVLGAIVSVLYNLSVRITGGVLVGFTNN